MKRCFTGMAAAAAFLSLCGCKSGGNAMDMAQMKKPAPPPEMAKLNSLVGEWDGTFTMGAPGETDTAKMMKMTSRSKTEPILDGMFLRETMEADMGPMGKMAGISMYWYDPNDKQYHTSWYSNWGEAMNGLLTYDEKKNEWHSSWKGKNPAGQDMIGEVVMSMPDHNTINFTMTEWDSWHMTRNMTGSGTAKRIK